MSISFVCCWRSHFHGLSVFRQIGHEDVRNETVFKKIQEKYLLKLLQILPILLPLPLLILLLSTTTTTHTTTVSTPITSNYYCHPKTNMLPELLLCTKVRAPLGGLALDVPRHSRVSWGRCHDVSVANVLVSGSRPISEPGRLVMPGLNIWNQ